MLLDRLIKANDMLARPTFEAGTYSDGSPREGKTLVSMYNKALEDIVQAKELLERLSSSGVKKL